MKRIVFPPNHGSNRPRSIRKLRCRQCHEPATHAEMQPRTATSISREGNVTRYTEYVKVYWCATHSGIAT